MVREIGEILTTLREAVVDFEKGETVRLLDGHSSPFKFPRGERLERRRFVSLVNSSLPALAYLTRNLTATSEVSDAEKADFVIGAINYRGTLLLRQHDPTARSKVVISEIRRNFNTPENQILALTLLAVLLYSTRSIESELAGRAEPGPSPVVQELESIRAVTRELLRSKRIKEILPIALANEQNIALLFERLKGRILQGRTPAYYSKAYDIFARWRNYLWIVFEGDVSLFNALNHHFDQLNDLNALYECWVCYRVLRGVHARTNSQLVQTSRSEGTVSFKSTDGELAVTYQRWANTGWIDSSRKDEPSIQPWDRPDIVVEVRGRNTPVVLDAKNSLYESGYPNREQMQSYLESVGANLGIFVHSRSNIPTWHQIERGNQRMVWTSMTPANPGEKNQDSEDAFQRIIDAILRTSA